MDKNDLEFLMQKNRLDNLKCKLYVSNRNCLNEFSKKVLQSHKKCSREIKEYNNLKTLRSIKSISVNEENDILKSYDNVNKCMEGLFEKSMILEKNYNFIDEVIEIKNQICKNDCKEFSSEIKSYHYTNCIKKCIFLSKYTDRAKYNILYNIINN